MFMCINLLGCMYTLGLYKPEEGIKSPGIKAKVSCNPLIQCWEVKPDPLQEQWMSLPTMPSLVLHKTNLRKNENK